MRRFEPITVFELHEFLMYHVKARNAWSRGLVEYADDLCYNIVGTYYFGRNSPHIPNDRDALHTKLLRGRSDWQDYAAHDDMPTSMIICRLVAPKDQIFDAVGPTRGITWKQAQGIAYEQAEALIFQILRKHGYTNI